MTFETPPSFKRRVTALTFAALAAVVEISVISLGAEALTRLAYRAEYRIDAILLLLPPYLFFGTIIAVPVCLAIGLPLWHFGVHHGRQNLRDAVRLGLATGTVIGSVVAVLLSEGSGATLTPTAFLMILLFSVAGISTGWIAHRIGYCAG
ncbi:hypothetical protein ACVOMT_07015 [Sphingomonas panni]|uniref:hypothetical protein n=1 Tax=uncultured Sphingomonas sp. TaxID=158754 RepID=UPI0025912A45|nr:hypothetical protein [uncultured Sphingomonas sp.]